MCTVLINFNSLFDLDCQILFSALKKTDLTCCFSHLVLQYVVSLARELFWNGHTVDYSMKKINQISLFATDHIISRLLFPDCFT